MSHKERKRFPKWRVEKEPSSREGTNTWLGQWRDVWTSWSGPTKGECNQDFYGSLVVKNLPASMRDTGSIPGPGRLHMLQGN